MKKRTITMATMLVAAMTVPLGKDYALSADRKTSLDDLLPKTEIIVEEVLTPFQMLHFKYDSATIDSVLNRPRINKEDLVDSVLNTISNYTFVVDKNFIKASIHQESYFDPSQVSEAGARGLMQFMPDTWKMMGEGKYNAAFNPVKSINAGIKYNLFLEKFISKRDPSWDTLSVENKRKKIAAAYNGGHGKLQNVNWNLEKMPEESRNHAEYITNFIKEYELEKEIVTAYYYIEPESMVAKIDIYSR